MKKTISMFLVLVSLQIPSWAETTDHPVKTALEDGAALASSPFRFKKTDLPVALGVVTAIGGLSLLDRTVQHHLFLFRDSRSSKDLRSFGDVGQLAGPIVGTVFALEGMKTGNQKSKETALLAYETFIWAGAIEVGMKYVVGRKRPSTTDDPFKFKPGGSNGAFPSGHTTTAFAAATVFAEQYPKWEVVVPAYAAAGLVGYSRLAANQHWLSDVAAGALLGTAVSHFICKRHRHPGDTAWSLNLQPDGVRIERTF